MLKRLLLRLVATLLVAAACLVVILVVFSSKAMSQVELAQADLAQAELAQPDEDSPQTASSLLLVVAEVNGLIDSTTASYLKEQVALAADDQAIALVLQLDSRGSTLSDADLAELLNVVANAAMPIGVWVGPSGATARGGAAQLVAVAEFSALAPGSTILPEGTPGRSPQQRDTVSLPVLSDSEAFAAGITSATAPSIGDFLLAISDAEIIPPISAEITNDAGEPQRTLSEEVSVSFVQLSLLDSLFHTAASPAIAYLLLLVGLSMVLLDFFTGGVGVAAAVGVGALALSAYGLGELDVRIWALVALVGAFCAFGIDLQAGIPRFWTVIGCIALVVGSLFVLGEHSLNWLPFVTGVGLAAVFVLFGMPALIRTRYGTAAVGREWLVGAVGVAVTDIDQHGTPGILEIDTAQWSARISSTSQKSKSPLRAGETAVVTGLSGVVLEVEPPG